jgi:hypothetical protein
MIYAVAIRWLGSPDPLIVDRALSPVGDWFRYNADTWLVETLGGAAAIRDALSRALSPDNGVLIIRIDPIDYAGWAPPEVWNWLGRKADPLVDAMAAGRNRLGP